MLVIMENITKRSVEGRRTGLVTSCVGTALERNVIEGNVEGRKEVTGRRERRRKQLVAILDIERGSTRLHSVENSVW